MRKKSIKEIMEERTFTAKEIDAAIDFIIKAYPPRKTQFNYIRWRNRGIRKALQLLVMKLKNK